MDKEERRQRINEIEDDLDDIREQVDECFGVLLNLLNHIQVGENYAPETCKEMYSEYREERKNLLRRIDDISEYKLRNLR